MAPETTSYGIELLPPELLCYIFGLVCHPVRGPGLRLELPLERPKPQLALTHVCARWRAVAIAKQSLWSLVLLSTGPKSRCLPFEPLKFLDRAGKEPLDVVLRLQAEPGGETECARLLASIASIGRHAARWRTFMFVSPLRFLYPAVFNALFRAPALEYLSLEFEHDIDYGTNLLFNTPPTPAALAHVSLYGLRMDTDARWLQGLRSLNITNPATDPNYYDLLTILQHCPELEALSLAFSGQQGVPDLNERASETIELRSLRRLELGINEAAYVEELLGQLFIPDLRLLEIQNGIYTRLPFASALLRPYQQTGLSMLNSVETFICDNGIEMQDKIFAALQNVRTLLLGEEQDLLQSLFPRGKPPGRVICPKLETIILWSSKDELKAFVKARMDAGAPLSTVIASFEGYGDSGADVGDLTAGEEAWFKSSVHKFRIGLDPEYLDIDELALNPVPPYLFAPGDFKPPNQTWRPNSVFRTSRAEGWAWHLNGRPLVDNLT